MIKKLKSKIFYLIMVALTAIILGIILLFFILNYKNTMNSATMMIDRFSNSQVRKNDKKENDKLIPDIDLDFSIEGLYSILVENNTIILDEDILYTDEIKQYAIKVSSKKQETGIIGKYVYKIRRIKENSYIITFLENEDMIFHIKVIFVFSIVASILSVSIIYVVAKRVSETIVKPVEETLNKQKQFISDASHELKTPLSVIEANADVLENKVGNNKWIRYIQNEVESMNKLVNELLLLAKMENIDNIKAYKLFNVSKETEIIISVFECMAYEKNVKINSNIQENIIMNGDKEDIKHILSTLIDNAIKHTNPGNEITVELTKEKNQIILQVKNMGEPIPDGEQEKIFERFYRVDKSRNRSEKRYGLGLAIAKSTVEKYNGKIEVFCKDGITNFRVNW